MRPNKEDHKAIRTLLGTDELTRREESLIRNLSIQSDWSIHQCKRFDTTCHRVMAAPAAM